MIDKTTAAARSELPLAPSPGAKERASGTSPHVAGGSFGEVMERLGKQIDRGEALVKRATSGGHAGLDAGELIALQAGIYRYTEAVDLAAKLVDRSAGAVKTVAQGSGG
jgi:hypothetical protein